MLKTLVRGLRSLLGLLACLAFVYLMVAGLRAQLGWAGVAAFGTVVLMGAVAAHLLVRDLNDDEISPTRGIILTVVYLALAAVLVAGIIAAFLTWGAITAVVTVFLMLIFALA